MLVEFDGKILNGIFTLNRKRIFAAYTQGIGDGNYYIVIQKRKGSAKTLSQLAYFHAVVVPTVHKQMIEDGNRTVKFEMDGRVKELPLTEDMVVVILKEIWAKKKGVKVKSKANMTKLEASELIDISIEWSARYLHCSIPEPSKL